MVTTDSNDFYNLLGVERGASEAEIKSAYKKAARKYHPDNRETGNEELFKKIGEAYETLKDPQKKEIYDRYGAEGLKGMGAQGGFSGGFADFGDLSDIMSSFFGEGFSGASSRGRGGRSRASRGQDHSVDLQLNFLDPIQSIKKKIKLNPLQQCSSCQGKGCLKPEDKQVCNTCSGHGQVHTVQNTILGQFRQSSTCPSCGGSGEIIKNPCNPCRGKGYKREEKEIEVTIPAGIYDGATMRLQGIGDVGRNGGPAGDIYLAIHVKDHPKFERQESDIYSEIKIGVAEAALGAKLEVPTIYGTKTLEIRSGTQSGELYTLRGEGMPRLNQANKKGDHYVKVSVQIPKHLSSKEKDLLKELQKLRESKDIEI